MRFLLFLSKCDFVFKYHSIQEYGLFFQINFESLANVVFFSMGVSLLIIEIIFMYYSLLSDYIITNRSLFFDFEDQKVDFLIVLCILLLTVPKPSILSKNFHTVQYVFCLIRRSNPINSPISPHYSCKLYTYNVLEYNRS